VGVGNPDKEKRLRNHLNAIMLLKQHGLCETGVIRAYHARRVAPQTARTLLLYEMMPSTPLDGMVLAQEALRDSEVAQHIKEATTMEEPDSMFSIPGHPAMRPDTGFIDLVSSFQLSHLGDPLSLLFNSES
jgi:hypothetical protein